MTSKIRFTLIWSVRLAVGLAVLWVLSGGLLVRTSRQLDYSGGSQLVGPRDGISVDFVFHSTYKSSIGLFQLSTEDECDPWQLVTRVSFNAEIQETVVLEIENISFPEHPLLEKYLQINEESVEFQLLNSKNSTTSKSELIIRSANVATLNDFPSNIVPTGFVIRIQFHIGTKTSPGTNEVRDIYVKRIVDEFRVYPLWWKAIEMNGA
jgi:hypothetical protein